MEASGPECVEMLTFLEYCMTCSSSGGLSHNVLEARGNHTLLQVWGGSMLLCWNICRPHDQHQEDMAYVCVSCECVCVRVLLFVSVCVCVWIFWWVMCWTIVVLYDRCLCALHHAYKMIWLGLFLYTYIIVVLLVARFLQLATHECSWAPSQERIEKCVRAIQSQKARGAWASVEKRLVMGFLLSLLEGGDPRIVQGPLCIQREKCHFSHFDTRSSVI